MKYIIIFFIKEKLNLQPVFDEDERFAKHKTEVWRYRQ